MGRRVMNFSKKQNETISGHITIYYRKKKIVTKSLVVLILPKCNISIVDTKKLY